MIAFCAFSLGSVDLNDFMMERRYGSIFSLIDSLGLDLL